MEPVRLTDPLWIDDYRRIEQAVQFIERNKYRQPELKEVADTVGLSEFHFQRLFSRWVGISPKRFLQYLTKEQAKAALQRSQNVLEAAYAAGLSGPGRLHDLLVTYDSVTPGEYRAGGEGIAIRYGFHPTPLGESLLALSPRGLSNMIFLLSDNREKALLDLRKSWPKARLIEAPSETEPVVESIFAFFAGNEMQPLPVHLRGTNFQLKVWEALLRIPPGSVVTYQDIAISIGLASSVRAVGQALGKNPLPVLIPCHRAISKAAGWGGYRYGQARKQALLGWEFAHFSS